MYVCLVCGRVELPVSENDFPTGDVGGDEEKRGRNSSANLTLEQFAQL